jgi:multiple sugar transport system substrate-binding protein
VGEAPGFISEFDAEFPGEGLFVENLTNVTKARPVLPTYDEISQIMATAVVKVMLGEAEPQQALDDAAEQVNTVLAGA